MDTEVTTSPYTALDAMPYAWPWHGRLDPRRLALLACVDGVWRGSDAAEAERRLAGLALAVRAFGGIVVALAPTGDAPGWLGADAVIAAPASSGFYATGLDALLRRGGRS